MIVLCTYSDTAGVHCVRQRAGVHCVRQRSPCCLHLYLYIDKTTPVPRRSGKKN